MSPVRALLISWEYPPVIEGGLGRHVRKLAEHLVEQGHDVHVLTRGGGRLPAEECRRGVSLHRVREPPFPRDLEAFLRWVTGMNRDMAELGLALCDSGRFDLVHSHDWLVAEAAEQVARQCGLPWLVTVHATEFGRHQGWVQKHPQSYIHGIERRMCRRADRLITCSEYMRGHVSRVFGVTTEQITAISNGVDPHDLAPIEGEDLAALRERFAGPSDLLVLLVGRLVFEKGFHLALDALAPLARRNGNLRFVVAGTGNAEAELKRQAEELGLARYGSFLGWVGDDMLHSLYRVADLCIVPSIYEPFGIVALEAMASGCLCVVADTGGLREVGPDDPLAVGNQAERVIDETDPVARRQLINEAREHVLQFGWDEVARRTAAVYAELAARSTSSGVTSPTDRTTTAASASASSSGG